MFNTVLITMVHGGDAGGKRTSHAILKKSKVLRFLTWPKPNPARPINHIQRNWTTWKARLNGF
ncbi:MAG: hypothetical protein ACYSU3_02705 [Planctomycetota bacterium]